MTTPHYPDRPDPLTPPGASTAGNDWFPLKFQRLRRSKWWRRASDTARARNVMMWGEAYSSPVPGSLPNDDDDLAEAAGYGLDVEAFLAVKAEIMAPWTLCSDDRWYHPTICEVVAEAWERAGERRRVAAEKKAAQRARSRGVPAETECVPRDIGNVPGDTFTDDTPVPGDMAKKQGDIALHTQQTQQDRQKTPPTPLGGSRSETFAKAMAVYPEVGKGGLDETKAWAAWQVAAAEIGEPALLGCIDKLVASQFAKVNGGGRVQALQRFLSTGRWRNWLTTATAPASTWNGPAWLREAIIAHVAEARSDRAAAEAWTISYVDGSTTWSEVPPALVCRAGAVEKQLRTMLASLLKDRGVAIIHTAAEAAA